MTATRSEIEPLTKPLSDKATWERFVAQVEAEVLEFLGPDRVLTDLTSRVMNRALVSENL